MSHVQIADENIDLASVRLVVVEQAPIAIQRVERLVGRAFSTGYRQRLFRFARKTDWNEVRLRVEIVFSRFINHPNVTILSSGLVCQDLINLAYLQVFAALILDTNHES